MLIEGIEKITVANGLLRISFSQLNAAGEGVISGEATIPVGSVETVINTLVKGVNDLNAQLQAQQNPDAKENKDASDKKSSGKNKKN
tara:strand:- start:509 stop:769 length:261 start_codon:yes stop_codon:yes gene_type:complete